MCDTSRVGRETTGRNTTGSPAGGQDTMHGEIIHLYERHGETNKLGSLLLMYSYVFSERIVSLGERKEPEYSLTFSWVGPCSNTQIGQVP